MTPSTRRGRCPLADHHSISVMTITCFAAWALALLLLPFIVLIVFSGVYPKPMLERIEPSVDRLLEHVQEHSDWQVPVAETEEGEG